MRRPRDAAAKTSASVKPLGLIAWREWMWLIARMRSRNCAARSKSIFSDASCICLRELVLHRRLFPVRNSFACATSAA